jgi:hydroxymethylbilane synthase
MAQARETRSRLSKAHDLQEDEFEIVVITTTGDRIRDRPLAEIGGKGLFTKEIEEALLEGAIDLAVHSMKDMPAKLPDGLVMPAVLPREDPRDAFISLAAPNLAGLRNGAVVGSSSVRRTAQLLRLRPDVQAIQFRGNVETRLKKLADGVAEATFLACAGLNRLGFADKITEAIPTDVMLPAVAQGAIGIEINESNAKAHALVDAINDKTSATAIACERAFLAALDGSCRTPLAGHAILDDGGVSFRGHAAAMGKDAGEEVKARGGSLIAF